MRGGVLFRGTQHNANFNVIGLTDAAGNLVERYEYTPYGQRQVYKVAGANDPDAHAPLHISSRVETTSTPGVAQPYALNPIGHQGLMHDEEVELINNRERILNPRMQSFNQRDPLGYVDGMNSYQYARSNSLAYHDPLGDRTFAFTILRVLTFTGSATQSVSAGPGAPGTMRKSDWEENWTMTHVIEFDCTNEGNVSDVFLFNPTATLVGNSLSTNVTPTGDVFMVPTAYNQTNSRWSNVTAHWTKQLQRAHESNCIEIEVYGEIVAYKPSFGAITFSARPAIPAIKVPGVSPVGIQLGVEYIPPAQFNGNPLKYKSYRESWKICCECDDEGNLVALTAKNFGHETKDFEDVHASKSERYPEIIYNPGP